MYIQFILNISIFPSWPFLRFIFYPFYKNPFIPFGIPQLINRTFFIPTFSMLFIFFKLTFVLTPICPHKFSLTILLIMNPISYISSSIGPHQCSIAMEFIIVEVPIISILAISQQHAISFFPVINKLTLIVKIRFTLNSFPIFFPILSFAFIRTMIIDNS